MELGCDARCYSRAGSDTMIWYCVILPGRQSLKLNRMCETMCRIQENLSTDGKLDVAEADQSLAPSVNALKNKRLTFAWLDGEAQEVSFYHHPSSFIPHLYYLCFLFISTHADYFFSCYLWITFCCNLIFKFTFIYHG